MCSIRVLHDYKNSLYQVCRVAHTASVGGKHTHFTEPENTFFMYLLQPLTSEGQPIMGKT